MSVDILQHGYQSVCTVRSENIIIHDIYEGFVREAWNLTHLHSFEVSKNQTDRKAKRRIQKRALGV